MLLVYCRHLLSFLFFFNDTATTEIYTLSLHDALPICQRVQMQLGDVTIDHFRRHSLAASGSQGVPAEVVDRSEEHTSELQSPCNLVCRLLLEKKKNTKGSRHHPDTLQRLLPYSHR